MSSSVNYLATFIFGLLIRTEANATCPTFHTLSNGTTADANAVMDNFNYILQCPNFTGNVGIGTASPTAKLHLYTPGGGTSSYAEIENGGSTTNDDIAALIVKGGQTNAYWLVGTNRADVGGAAANLFFYNGATANKVVMTPTGNVGIGTATPSAKLHLYTTGGGQGTYASIENSGTTPNDDMAALIVKGGQTNAYWLVGTNRADVGGTAANLVFYNGTTTNKVVITPTGSVGIGTTAPAQALEVNGQIKVDLLASASGTALCINANVISSCSSSRRYKEKIRDASFGLKEIEAMRPVTFKWKGRDEQDFGLIAEEVAKIDPRYVTYKAGKIEGVKYPQLTAVLVNAVKQLRAANDSRASEIGRLRAQNVAFLGLLKKQAAEAQDTHNRLSAIERRINTRTAENYAAEPF